MFETQEEAQKVLGRDEPDEREARKRLEASRAKPASDDAHAMMA